MFRDPKGTASLSLLMQSLPGVRAALSFLPSLHPPKIITLGSHTRLWSKPGNAPVPTPRRRAHTPENTLLEAPKSLLSHHHSNEDMREGDNTERAKNKACFSLSRLFGRKGRAWHTGLSDLSARQVARGGKGNAVVHTVLGLAGGRRGKTEGKQDTGV